MRGSRKLDARPLQYNGRAGLNGDPWGRDAAPKTMPWLGEIGIPGRLSSLVSIKWLVGELRPKY